MSPGINFCYYYHRYFDEKKKTIIMYPAHIQQQVAVEGVDLTAAGEVPMSRTHQYRKVMKPLLERKRRARINRCLDDLKDLMVEALQSEGESIAKLEKADVLELTVRHLQKLKRQRMLQANPSLDSDRYTAGFSACASEVSRCLATVPGVDVSLGTTLMSHLGAKVQHLQQQPDEDSSSSISAPLTVSVRKSSTPSSVVTDGGYSSGRESASPRSPAPVNYCIKREREEDEEEEDEELDVVGLNNNSSPSAKRSRRESSSSESSGVWRPF